MLLIFILPNKINDIIPASSTTTPPLEVALITQPIVANPPPTPIAIAAKVQPIADTKELPEAPTSAITEPEIKLPKQLNKIKVTKAKDKDKVLPESTAAKPTKLIANKVPPVTTEAKTPVHLTKAKEDIESLIAKSTTAVVDAPKIVATSSSTNISNIAQANNTQKSQINYANSVANQIRPFINIPPNTNENTQAVVQVLLLPNMQVKSVNLTKSSGNPQYDSSVIQAVRRQDTFPPIPDGEKWADFKKISLTFHPN